jgi:hypothetical protein
LAQNGLLFSLEKANDFGEYRPADDRAWLLPQFIILTDLSDLDAFAFLILVMPDMAGNQIFSGGLKAHILAQSVTLNSLELPTVRIHYWR